MVDANLKIIEELKFFLTTVAEDAAIRKLVTESESDFTRERKLPLKKVVGIIINMPKRSLSIEIAEFFDSLEKGLDASTKGAFSLQRTKLQPLFFKVWNRWLVTCFYKYYGTKVKRWRGFRLQAVDGSTAYLLNKDDVVEYFGKQENQYGGIAMGRIMQVHDILNDITVWGDIRPIQESEQAIMAEQVSYLFEDSLTIFDRGYPSYALMYLMMNEEKERHFVMRCRASFNNEVREFLKSSKSSQIIELFPNESAIKTLRKYHYKVSEKTALKVRMVKVKLPTGEVEILLSSLLNEKLYTIADLRYLYGLRWGIETTFSKHKNQQQLEQFSGHRVICIQQDYAAGIFVANLQSIIEKQCEAYLKRINLKRKHNHRINRNVSWACMKNTIVKLFLHNNPREILSQLQGAFERNTEPVRPGRTNPRVKKARRLNGKYQTFTNYRRAI